MRPFRLVPVVLFATTSLFALKLVGLLAGNGYTLAGPPSALAQVSVPPAPSLPRAEAPVVPPSVSKKSWAQENLGYPDITGSVKAAPPDAGAPAEAKAKPPGPESKPADPAPNTIDPQRATLPPGERVVLERLGERRQELEAQARELEIRENLLKTTEQRIEARLAELNELESRINATSGKKTEVEAAKLKAVVTMYESMKAKDAARIFDRLDMKILVDVASQINPRRMSDILAQMNPEAAEKLTVELAGRPLSPNTKAANAAELPKIEGRPRM